MSATTQPAPCDGSHADVARLRDLAAALAIHGTAYECMAQERRRLVVKLRASGMAPGHIAELTGMTPTTVYFLAHRAKRDHRQGADS